MLMQVLHYLDPNHRDPFQEWLNTLRDIRGQVAILRRIDRLVNGNFGDHKFCQNNVWELRIPIGPGYRVCRVGGGARRLASVRRSNWGEFAQTDKNSHRISSIFVHAQGKMLMADRELSHAERLPPESPAAHGGHPQ